MGAIGRGFYLFWFFALIPLLAQNLPSLEGYVYEPVSSYKYSYVPKKLYVNQVFPLTVMETHAVGAPPHFRFAKAVVNADLIVKTPLIIRNGEDRFFSFYFKARRGDEVYFPTLYIEANDAIFNLDPQHIPLLELPPQKGYCGVLATYMKIRYAQVSHYDASHYLVTLSLEAYEANLEDMKLEEYDEYGMENLKRHYAKVTGEFYVVVPETLKELSFSYYNTVKERFITLRTPVEINDATVVTQTDLNPQNDKFDLFKKYTMIALTGFFFLMFLLTRDLFYLALGAVALIVTSTFYVPRKTVCVKEGTPLYILPTDTSDISTRITHRIEATPLLNTRGKYNKIEYRNGIVGWVKNEDLCQN
jgi:hypothetical protein